MHVGFQITLLRTQGCQAAQLCRSGKSKVSSRPRHMAAVITSGTLRSGSDHMLHMRKTSLRLSPSQTELKNLPLEAQEPEKRACRSRNSQHFDHQAYCSCCLSFPPQQPAPVLQEDSPAFRVTPCTKFQVTEWTHVPTETKETTLTFPSDTAGMGMGAGAAAATCFGDDGVHPAILAVILSKNEAFEGFTCEPCMIGGDKGSATGGGAGSSVTVSGMASDAGGSCPGGALSPKLKLDLPPGAASTREDGRSPKKLPTFCPSGRE